MRASLVRASASLLVSSLGFVVFAQAPSTSSTSSTSTTDASDLLCTVDRVGAVSCLIVPPRAPTEGARFEWRIDGRVLTGESGAALSNGPILAAGTHHIEVVAITATQRSDAFADDVTVAASAPIPGPDSVKFPPQVWYGIAILVGLALSWIIRWVRTSDSAS